MTTIQTTSGFTPSVYQDAIFKWIEEPNPKSRVIIVQAVAGSGKSRTLKEGCKLMSSSDRILFVAFAKKNVEDLKPGLPANAEAATLNSIGHRAWMRFIGANRIAVNGDQNFQFIHEAIDRETGNLADGLKDSLREKFKKIHGIGIELERYDRLLNKSYLSDVYDISRLIALAKNNGLVPSKIIQKTGYDYYGSMEDSRDNWIGLIDAHDLSINLPDAAIEIARMVLYKAITKASEEIDYDSQLWLPVIHGVKFNQYDWLLIDEIQDLSSIQVEIACKLMRDGGRGIFVGDSRQSIYGFRGAMTTAMDEIKGRFGAEEFPLSICYRCAKEVVKHAAKIVPHIQHHEDQIDGVVDSLATYNPTIFGKNDVVICRNTSPLIKLACKLYKAKVPCKIMGRDIEHGLVNLIKRCSDKSGRIDVLESHLKEFCDREIEKARRKDDYDRVEKIKDKADAIAMFIGDLPERSRSVNSLIENINRVFRMDKVKSGDVLSLSSGHRTKGGEWDNVFFLDSQLIPSKMAQSKEALRAEENLRYVIITRAKKKLTYISSNGLETA